MCSAYESVFGLQFEVETSPSPVRTVPPRVVPVPVPPVAVGTPPVPVMTPLMQAQTWFRGSVLNVTRSTARVSKGCCELKAGTGFDMEQIIGSCPSGKKVLRFLPPLKILKYSFSPLQRLQKSTGTSRRCKHSGIVRWHRGRRFTLIDHW